MRWRLQGGVGFRKEKGFDLELRRNINACRGGVRMAVEEVATAHM